MPEYKSFIMINIYSANRKTARRACFIKTERENEESLIRYYDNPKNFHDFEKGFLNEIPINAYVEQSIKGAGKSWMTIYKVGNEKFADIYGVRGESLQYAYDEEAFVTHEEPGRYNRYWIKADRCLFNVGTKKNPEWIAAQEGEIISNKNETSTRVLRHNI